MKKVTFAFLFLILSVLAWGQTPGTVRFPTNLDTSVSLLEVQDRASTTLNGAITSGATTITVTSTSLFPATGTLTIDDERMYYTAKTSTTFTVVRGQFSSTAAAHSNGATVRMNVMAIHHTALRDALIAVQTKLGYSASTPTTTGHVLTVTGAGTTAWQAPSVTSILPVADTQTIIKGSADATKLIRFEADGITTGTTRVITAPDSDTTLPIFSQVITFSGPTAARTITLPDASFTVVGLTQTQTLTNKTLTAPIISTISNTGTLTLPTSTDTLVGRATTDTLTNKTIAGSTNTITPIDTNFTITGSADLTKIARFEVDGLTTATTRVVTVPDANIVMAGSASALTSGRIPYVTTGGLLTDSANWTYTTGSSPNFLLQAANAAHVAAVFRGAAAQSANLTEWQNSAGTALLSVASDGSIVQTVTKSGTSSSLVTNVLATFQNTAGFNRAAIYQGISAPSGASTAWVKALEAIAQLGSSAAFITSGSLMGVQGEVRIPSGTVTGTMGGAVYGIAASVNNQNSSVTVTNAYGVYAFNPQRTGAITNYSAFYTEALTAADYAFYSAGTGRVYIGDTTNSTSATTGALLLNGGIGLADAKDISFGTTTGTKIGTATTQKIGFFNATPIVQPSSTGETAGFTAGAGTNVTDASTFTGNVGSTAYRISDIVKALKNLGLIAQ